MNVTFEYDLGKDIWCILNKGKASNNSSQPTKMYELLVEQCGDNPTEADVSGFIEGYLTEQNVKTAQYKDQYKQEWELIANEYHKRAQTVFSTTLPIEITAYLTLNNRCPYSISDNLFYVSFPRETIRKTVMHELWHFYTWYGLGAEQEEKLGKQKYNDMKEALTVLLNEECADLMPKGVSDEGYPQHRELREKIKTLWQQNKDIKIVWGTIATNQLP